MSSGAEHDGPFRQDPTFDPERRRIGLVVCDVRRRISLTTREPAARAR
jgi:hypothetical protein